MFLSDTTLRQSLAIIPVAFANLMNGFSWGWLVPALLTLRRSLYPDLTPVNDDYNLMVVALYPGYFLGCLLSSFLALRFGRNSVVSSAAVITLLSWTVVAHTQNLMLLQLTRVASGLSIGMSSVITPIYVAENSSPHIRGVFSSITNLLTHVGTLGGCVLATYCCYQTTSCVLLFLSMVNLISGLLLKEPAQHLLAKGLQEEAETRFFWLQDKDKSTLREFDDLMSNLEENAKPWVSFIWQPHFIITCICTELVFLTGHPTIMAMTYYILESTVQFSNKDLYIICSLLQLAGFMVSLFIIDRFDRRTLWMLSAILIAISLFFSATLYILKHFYIEVPFYNWLLFASISVYGIIVAAIMYPLAMVAKAELIPQKFRATGTAIVTILNFGTSIVVALCFSWIMYFSIFAINFVVFFLCSLIMLAFVYFKMPETKGLSLMEIEKKQAIPNDKLTEI